MLLVARLQLWILNKGCWIIQVMRIF